jgi:hypothetical protein
MKGIIVKYYQPVVVFILTLTVASLFAIIGIDPCHHGIMFKPAFDVAHGQMLFRDTFTQYGALTTLLQACALRIFGDYLVVIQIETAVFYGLISVCLWYLWLHILPQWLATISVLIWLLLSPYFVGFFLPWSSVYALFFQLFSLFLLLYAVREESRPMIMLAGNVAVLTFWCRQPVGVFHCSSLVFFLATSPLMTGRQWKNAITDCAFFIVGIVAASMPFFVWFAINGAIHDMYLQSIKAAFFFGNTYLYCYGPGSYNVFKGILLSLLGHLPWHQDFFYQFPMTSPIWGLLPLVCLSLLALLIIKRHHNCNNAGNHLTIYGILLVSLASWPQYYPFADMIHCYYAATPMIGVFCYSAWRLCIHKQKGIQFLILFLILVSVFGYDIEKRISIGLRKINIKTEFQEPKVLRGMYEIPNKSEILKVMPDMYSILNEAETYNDISTALNNALKRNPFPYLVNLSSDALYLTFLGPQKNYHPMYINWNGWNNYNDFIYPDFKNRTNEFINKKHPLILWYEGISIPGWTCIDIFNLMDADQKSKKLHGRRLALYRFEE